MNAMIQARAISSRSASLTKPLSISPPIAFIPPGSSRRSHAASVKTGQQVRSGACSGTEREISANIEHQESATKDLCFLVSILQVRAKVVSFSVSFPNSTLHALIAFLVLIPRRASMDG